MKEIDKIGFLCITNVFAISLFYLQSDFNLIVSSVAFFAGLFSVGIITRKYQKTLEVKK